MGTRFITAILDDHLEGSLRDLVGLIRRELGGKGQNPHRPHVTFAAYPGVVRLEADLDRFCELHVGAQLVFRALGCFAESNVVFASPVVTEELLRLHREMHAHFGAITEHSHYLVPGSWAPHCALYVAPDSRRMVAALELASRVFTGLEGEIQGFGIVEPPAPNDSFRCALSIRDV